jgi:AraC-like DNA-binding protein/TolB-like protein
MDGTRWVEPGRLIEQTVLPHLVKRALDYMRDNLTEKIVLSEVARACATSERTLLKQFQRHVGLSPLAYLRRHRLNVARHELLKAESDVTISDIAARCGYLHLGRFAGDYRRLFNEPPSATRKRARSQAADSPRAGNGGAGFRSHATAAWRARPSLLILPFQTEGLKERLEARDLTDRLAAVLSRMRVATVKLPHPAQRISMTTGQPRNAGSEYCLQGRVTHRDERTRVIVRLVDVGADRHLWGDSFDGSVHDPFELQDRVVDGVLCGAVSHITDAEIERAYNKDPHDRGARDLALQALPLILGTSVPNARSAMEILDRALELDPADATSMALLACSHAQLGTYHGTQFPAVARDAALELSRRAGMLDNSDPLVTAARSTATALALQTDEAEALVTRALAMDPTSAWAWERRGFLRLNSPTDADRAMSDFQRALQLRGPHISRANCFVGIATAHCKADRMEETEFWTRRAIAENPEAWWVHRWQSCYATKMGDRPRIRAAVEHWRRAQPEITVSLLMACFPPSEPGWLEELVRAGVPL